MSHNILQSIRTNDHQSASERVTSALQQKLAERLAAERKTLAEGLITENGFFNKTLKSFQRAIAGWGGDADSPAELIARNKEYDNNTIRVLYHTTKTTKGGSVAAFQHKVLARIMRQRNIKPFKDCCYSTLRARWEHGRNDAGSVRCQTCSTNITINESKRNCNAKHTSGAWCVMEKGHIGKHQAASGDRHYMWEAIWPFGSKKSKLDPAERKRLEGEAKKLDAAINAAAGNGDMFAMTAMIAARSQLKKQLKEATSQAELYPHGWDKGFDGGWQVGGGGKETPFQKRGKWYLYVWNSRKRKHAYYSYADDTYLDVLPEHCDDPRTDPTDGASKLYEADIMPHAEVQRVYDETGDIGETETLTGVSDIKVNEAGQVISFVDPALTEDKKLPVVHAGSPVRTNANINRERAIQMYKAGMTARDIAKVFPEVFSVDRDGMISMKYDYELGDGSGRYETKRVITKSAADAAIKKFQSHVKEAWERSKNCQQCKRGLSAKEFKAGDRVCGLCVSTRGSVFGKDSDDDYVEEAMWNPFIVRVALPAGSGPGSVDAVRTYNRLVGRKPSPFTVKNTFYLEWYCTTESEANTILKKINDTHGKGHAVISRKQRP